METKLNFRILPQPDDTTCGPTCLHAVYNYYGEDLSLEQVIKETPSLEGGGALAVQLGCHALAKGYKGTIYTYNLQVFDPTWFQHGGPAITERLKRQREIKKDQKLHTATGFYLDFLKLGGSIRFEDLTAGLIRNYLKRGIPILTGLSSTYLYQTSREYGVGNRMIYDDVQGEPSGHFVVLCGYNREARTALVADPLRPNPISHTPIYEVNLNRLICSIMLGTLTFDANLLVLVPRGKRT